MIRHSLFAVLWITECSGNSSLCLSLSSTSTALIPTLGSLKNNKDALLCTERTVSERWCHWCPWSCTLLVLYLRVFCKSHQQSWSSPRWFTWWQFAIKIFRILHWVAPSVGTHLTRGTKIVLIGMCKLGVLRKQQVFGTRKYCIGHYKARSFLCVVIYAVFPSSKYLPFP